MAELSSETPAQTPATVLGRMIPQDMWDARTVMLYKNKGDRSDCNNYRSISLLSVVGKAFAHVVLKRLQLLADRV